MTTNDNIKIFHLSNILPVAVLCIVMVCSGSASATVFINGPITELQHLDQEGETYIITGNCSVTAPTALYVEADNITITANETVTLTCPDSGLNAKGVMITNNVGHTTITNITFSGFLNGIYAKYGSENVTIDTCSILNGTMVSEPAIRLQGRVSNLSVLNSHIQDQEGLFADSGPYTGIIIRNTTFSDITDAAIDPLNLYDSVIENNSFIRCKYGIMLNNANPDVDAGVVISNNTFMEFSNIGIRLMDIGGVTICDNTIVGDRAVTTPSSSKGISLTYNVNDTEINRNTIERCGDYGIICYESSGITGTGNIIMDNEQGINLQRAGQRTFTDTLLSGNTDGIVITKNAGENDLFTNVILTDPETHVTFTGTNVGLNESGSLPGDAPEDYLFTGAVANVKEDLSTEDVTECTVTFYYTADEVENITESDLTILRSEAPSGWIWADTPSVVNTTARTVSAGYTFTPGEEELFFALAGPVKPDEVTVAVNLSAGWNMVSVPVQNTSYDIPPEVQPIIYRYNGNTYAEVTDLSTLEGPDGYWVAATGPCTLTMTGAPVENFTHTSTAGWNMIGSVAAEIPFEDHITSDPAGLLGSAIYTYDPGIGQYTTPTVCTPGCGYWVSMATDGDILIG